MLSMFSIFMHHMRHIDTLLSKPTTTCMVQEDYLMCAVPAC